MKEECRREGGGGGNHSLALRPLGIHLVKRQIPQLPLDNRMKDRDGSQRASEATLAAS